MGWVSTEVPALFTFTLLLTVGVLSMQDGYRKYKSQSVRKGPVVGPKNIMKYQDLGFFSALGSLK